MLAYFVILALAILNLLTGHLIIRALPPIQTDWVGHLAARFTLGVVLNGWLLLILAELGYFSALTIAAQWVLSALILTRLGNKTPRQRPTKFSPSSLIVILWLPLALLLFFRPHQYHVGAADVGVYVNLAISIARTGGILIQDATLAALNPDLYPHLLRTTPAWEHAPFAVLPAFFTEIVGSGQITPQFYHMHPVWQAVATVFGGVPANLLMQSLWAVAATLTVFLATRTITNEVAAFLLLAGLTFNALQIWFARYPTTEPLTQFFIWVSLWALAEWFQEPDEDNRTWALLAACGFGMAMLTRIDTFFFLAAPALLGIWAWIKRKSPAIVRSYVWFAVPFTILAVHTFVHAWWQSRPYFLNTFATMITILFRPWYLPFVIGQSVLLGY